jgi:hypothetical protein
METNIIFLILLHLKKDVYTPPPPPEEGYVYTPPHPMTKSQRKRHTLRFHSDVRVYSTS